MMRSAIPGLRDVQQELDAVLADGSGQIVVCHHLLKTVQYIGCSRQQLCLRVKGLFSQRFRVFKPHARVNFKDVFDLRQRAANLFSQRIETSENDIVPRQVWSALQ